MKDFSIEKYEELCSTLLENNYDIITFRQYLSGDHETRFAILRHDVDSKSGRALRMAKIENKMGINASYYFRTKKSVFNLDIIKSIYDLGHEIGYHYEVLSKTGGDHLKAIKLFERELNEFRKFVDIETICMHGSPLSKYDNRDLWKLYDFRFFGLAGEAYLSAGDDLDYFSDTGWSWGNKNKLRDIIKNNRSMKTFDMTDDILSYMAKNAANKIYLLVHPENWTNSNCEWYCAYGENRAKNFAKSILKILYDGRF